MTQKRVWLFREGNADMRNLLGGKGANLAEMTNLGLPVPPGLTITTETCMDYINNGNKMPEGLMDEVKAALKVKPVKNLVTFIIHFLYLFVPVQEFQCLV